MLNFTIYDLLRYAEVARCDAVLQKMKEMNIPDASGIVYENSDPKKLPVLARDFPQFQHLNDEDMSNCALELQLIHDDVKDRHLIPGKRKV